MNDFFADFNIVAERDYVYEIAQRYVDECEEYDRTVCQFANKCGEAQPVMPHERALCDHFAMAAWGRAQDAARGVGATTSALRKALHNVRCSLPRLPQGPIK